MLPLMNGFDVAQRLQADPATSRIPIVFMTALATGDDRKRRVRGRGVGYIVKPFDPVSARREHPADARPPRARRAGGAQAGAAPRAHVRSRLARADTKRLCANGQGAPRGADRTLFVLFDLLGEKVDFQPGQYFWVTLLEPPYDDEKGPRRHISVATSPNDRGVLGLATRLRDSAFKRCWPSWRSAQRSRSSIRKATSSSPAETDLPYVFVAGGIGITVFRSMLLYISEEDLPHRVTLVYSNRDRASAAFLDELTRLASERDDIDLVLTMTQDDGWDGETRVVGPELLRDHLDGDLDGYRYLLAGPPAMVEAVTDSLREAGIPDELIHPERFSGY